MDRHAGNSAMLTPPRPTRLLWSSNRVRREGLAVTTIFCHWSSVKAHGGHVNSSDDAEGPRPGTSMRQPIQNSSKAQPSTDSGADIEQSRGQPAEAAAPAGGGGAPGAVSISTICSVNFTACRRTPEGAGGCSTARMASRRSLHVSHMATSASGGLGP